MTSRTLLKYSNSPVSGTWKVDSDVYLLVQCLLSHKHTNRRVVIFIHTDNGTEPAAIVVTLSVFHRNMDNSVKFFTNLMKYYTIELFEFSETAKPDNPHAGRTKWNMSDFLRRI